MPTEKTLRVALASRREVKAKDSDLMEKALGRAVSDVLDGDERLSTTAAARNGGVPLERLQARVAEELARRAQAGM